MNISFKQRILLGFFSLIAMMGIIIAISLIQFNKARTSSIELNDQLLPVALAAQNMALDILQVQQLIQDGSVTHNTDSFIQADSYANDFKQQNTALQAMAFLSDDKKAELVRIGAAFDNYYAIGRRMGTAYIEQGMEAGNVLMGGFDEAATQLNDAMARFRDNAIERETHIAKDLSEGVSSATQNIIIASILIIIVSVLISYYLTRYLYLQLGIDPFYAKGIAKEIAKGNFSREIQLEPGDNGSLLAAIKQIQQSINDFVAALEHMMKKHDEGWIWETIDASKYPGTYGRLAKDINRLVRSHIDVKMQVVEVISHYAKGDFTMDMPRFTR
ncbi:hypothetical protein VZ94_06545 [Methylocucumis oryzae]|uniref:Uncharacterized protein n=1 Tax=Methylocucumis oryzae TaxID=1632867 RepID=A0A0F3IKD4_9GAMM|nr:hypothetical protein VZ94_06545 [Methylocucumis oryzae]